jgi:signal transduction histidine kinase
MHRFRNLAIQYKLITITMLACGTALLLACSAFTIYEVITFRGAVIREMTTLAGILAESSTAALVFSDAKAAQDNLQMLRGDRRIVSGAIYSGNGEVFATYRRAGERSSLPQPPVENGVHLLGSHLVLYQPIVFHGERVGSVYLKSELREIQATLFRFFAIATGVMLLSSIVALLVSSLLQKIISQPILNLSETAGRVSSEQNYSFRAAKTSGDELGVLVDRFNEMMSQIQARDAALQQAQDQLELRVEDRTKQLKAEIVERQRIEENLLAAMHAAEESNRAKSIFLANMSHELRTPLNAIIGYSEMLEEDAEERGQHEIIPDLQKIHSSGRHLLVLINDVLDVSKIEAGKIEFHFQPMQASSFFGDVAAAIEPLARKNGNKFEWRSDNLDAVMNVDPVRFRQSLLNLLSNACKFTEHGVVSLDITREVREEQEWLNWNVRDTGIGISPDQQKRLFQAFSQVDPSATRRYGGSGLGLAISQKFCQAMGGRITVESDVGRGSTFTIRMPAVSPDAALAANQDADCESRLREASQMREQ